ncbi:MAG: hypothetical protein WDO56_08445 [Gammaproteobacteria bacterium]
MFEELFNLLCRLGLGPAARPACDLVADLTGEAMTLQQLQQEIRSVLRPHGCAHRVGVVISALAELGLAGFVASTAAQGEDSGSAASKRTPRPGTSPIDGSVLLAEAEHMISIDLNAVRRVPDSARGWLDIDGGIYFDVRQHGAGSDSKG